MLRVDVFVVAVPSFVECLLCRHVQLVKRVRRRRRESQAVQVAMSCVGCERLLTAQLQDVSTELQADTDQQLHHLKQRVHECYSQLHSCLRTVCFFL